jgi:predicted ester cyclase
MDTASNKELVRRFYEEVVNTGNTERIADFISPDLIETDGLTRVHRGIQGMIEHVRGVRKTYPDLRVTIERQIAEGDWVVSIITARGTHLGEWLGIAPTGRQLVYGGVNVDKVVEGKMVEHGGAANLLGPLLEVGAVEVVSSLKRGAA